MFGYLHRFSNSPNELVSFWFLKYQQPQNGYVLHMHGWVSSWLPNKNKHQKGQDSNKESFHFKWVSLKLGAPHMVFLVPKKAKRNNLPSVAPFKKKANGLYLLLTPFVLCPTLSRVSPQRGMVYPRKLSMARLGTRASASCLQGRSALRTEPFPAPIET